jgi:hypothetical protein
MRQPSLILAPEQEIKPIIASPPAAQTHPLVHASRTSREAAGSSKDDTMNRGRLNLGQMNFGRMKSGSVRGIRAEHPAAPAVGVLGLRS